MKINHLRLIYLKDNKDYDDKALAIKIHHSFISEIIKIIRGIHTLLLKEKRKEEKKFRGFFSLKILFHIFAFECWWWKGSTKSSKNSFCTFMMCRKKDEGWTKFFLPFFSLSIIHENAFYWESAFIKIGIMSINKRRRMRKCRTPTL